MVYAKRVNQKGVYKVHVRKIFLRHGQGGESAQSSDPNVKVVPLDVDESELNKGGVIVDSGTTDTYFSSRMSPQFRAVFQGLSGMAFNHNEFAIEARELSALPTILVQLEGDVDLNKQLGANASQVVGLAGDMDPEHPYDIMVAIPPSHYMEIGSGGKYFARFYLTDASGGILGANAMMGHDVLFDVDNQVVGWAESHCEYHRLVTENGFNDPLDGTTANSESKYDKAAKELHKKQGKQDSEEGHESRDTFFQMGAVEVEFHEMKDACGSWYCRGILSTVLCAIFCFGCCLGLCCCQSRSVNYKLTKHEELNSSQDSENERSYHDNPSGDGYWEFVLT